MREGDVRFQMQGTLIAHSGAELVGGGEKPLFRDDWGKKKNQRCIAHFRGNGEAVLSLFRCDKMAAVETRGGSKWR